MTTEVATRADFSRIRYAQVWEDADVLLAALDIQPTDTVVSIASAGDNALALLGAGAARVVALDLNPAQLACLALRVAAYRELSHPELLELIGSRPSTRRAELYRRCRPRLTGPGQAFWDANSIAVAQGIGGAGKFEDCFRLFRSRVLPLVHGRSTVEQGDAALVTFTSGSTGVPKAVVRTHEFLVVQHRVLEPGIDLQAGEVDLATLPIFTLANLASGVTTVIPNLDLRRPGNVDAARVFRQVERFGVTRITASPAFFERLIEHGKAAGETLPTLRKLHTGGAPVFPRLLGGLRELAPNAEVVAVYGSTEAEPMAHLAARAISADDLMAMQNGQGLLAGAAVEAITLRILRDRWGAPRGSLTNEELDAETLPAGEAGEIVVTGEHVLRGYLGGIGDAETKFLVDGKPWHRTGDAGRRDQRGRVWLLGRCAARIEDEHGCLHPFAVECVAMNFPEVRRAAVLAHQGARWLVIETRADRGLLGPRLLAATAWALFTA